MYLDGYMVADATGAEVVRLPDIAERLDNLQDLMLCLLRKRTLREFIDRSLQQFIGHLYQHQTYHDGGQRIEHRPTLT